MANNTELKNAIAQVIKTNGNQEITGQVLQNTLNSIISSIGSNATFAGIATPTTSPGTPDQNVFYFAVQAGTYVNFGGLDVKGGFNIIKNNASGNWVLSNVYELVEELGDSETAVINQKAVTTELVQVRSDLNEKFGDYVENPEYARAYTDTEGRFLWGIKQDGSIEFAKGVPTPIKNYIIEFVFSRLIPIEEAHEQYLKESENPEWARVIVDTDGRVLWGIRKDGSVEFTKGVPSAVKNYIDSRLDEEVERINQLVISLLADVNVLTDTYHYISNPEYAKVVVDPEGHVLFGIKNDGSCYIPKGISEEAKQGLLELNSRIFWFETESNPEWLQVTTDSEGKIIEGVGNDGKKFFPKQEMLEKYKDVEGRTEITLDEGGKILSFRDSDGIRHESKQYTEVASFGNMNLTSENATQIEEALSKNGFTVKSPIDWSDKELIELPIPRQCAIVNFIVPKLAVTKTENIEGYLEYWDKGGNYFKKSIILNAQGSSSMEYVEKNQSVDFTDCEIKFGTWVTQDSFHFKCYYIDVFRGIANICYNYVEEAIKYVGCRSNRIVLQDSKSLYDGTGKFANDFGDNALCHPDGFPIEVYLNGEYYGLFAWNLKKHRKNYSMEKKDSTKTLLDGNISYSTFFGGNIDWTQFELRNPKDLATMNGSEYDADTNCNELIDESSVYYDGSNEAHTNSAKIKKLVERQSNAIQLLKAETNIESAKIIFESYYDKEMVFLYFIMSNVVGNYDGFSKNWQWTIYGNIAAPNFYDMDSVLGRIWKGNGIKLNGQIEDTLGTSPNLPTGQALRLYQSDIESMYNALRGSKIISVDKFMSYVYDWIDRAGIDNIEKNIEKWTPPSYRNSYVNKEYWEQIGEYGNNAMYDSTKDYSVGDTCYYGIGNSVYDFLLYKCIKACKGVVPATQFYNDPPRTGGMYDSPSRIKNWLEAKISYLDEYFNYNV